MVMYVLVDPGAKVGFLHHREGVSRECVPYRIALAYRSAIESKDPLPIIVGCHGHHCTLMAHLFCPGALDECLCLTGVFLWFDRLETHVEDCGRGQ